MCAILSKRAKAVLCIGETGPTLASDIAARSPSTGLPVLICGDLATAVARARTLARRGDIVLLSPGAPSYDQFVNFEQRGHRFNELVRY